MDPSIGIGLVIVSTVLILIIYLTCGNPSRRRRRF